MSDHKLIKWIIGIRAYYNNYILDVYENFEEKGWCWAVQHVEMGGSNRLGEGVEATEDAAKRVAFDRVTEVVTEDGGIVSGQKYIKWIRGSRAYYHNYCFDVCEHIEGKGWCWAVQYGDMGGSYRLGEGLEATEEAAKRVALDLATKRDERDLRICTNLGIKTQNGGN